MRQSQLFTKTRFEAPKDEVAKNAELLIRGGFIHKDMAGVYSMLPLGLRVMNKIENIVREEMNALGASEVSLATLQNKELWEKTGRWDDKAVDNWFKTKFANGSEAGLGFSHEEPLTNLLKDHIRSYKDLPISIYQFQTKFRNEARSKSGILRCREFLMKDMYSFSRNEEEHEIFYKKATDAYLKIFKRIGIGEKTYFTFASGGSFSKYSHEFQTETDAGEDTIYFDSTKNIAINKEVYNDEVIQNIGADKKNLIEKKAIEVGNIFTLGTRFSEALGLNYKNEKGESVPVVMGCYGIGIGRLMGTIVEISSDDKGIVWPKSISPFTIHLVATSLNDEVMKYAQELYQKLQAKGVSVLFDDRDVRAGEKFADADLIGIPTRVIVGDKALADAKKYDTPVVFEVKDRASGSVSSFDIASIVNLAKEY